MKTRDLVKIGIPAGRAAEAAKQILQRAQTARRSMAAVEDDLRSVAAAPAEFVNDPRYAELATLLVEQSATEQAFVPRATDAPYRIWGDHLESTAVDQLKNACKLPVSVAGALMPDAHVGYGLPIGGVLATRDAVIPYAVGVDIACRMKLTVLDLPVQTLATDQARLTRAIERETRFGMGASFETRRQHDVMDADWRVTSVTARMKDRAWAQLGTSGSGNHFVEFGLLTVLDDAAGLAPGKYLALLSHSGSRGAGAQVADHYSRLARDLHPELPKELSHLSWLELSSEAGQEVLGRHGADGTLCRRQSRAHPRARGARAGRRRPARHREPPQLRMARTPSARRWQRRRRDRASQGCDARRCWCPRHHPRFDGHTRLRRARQGRGRVLNSAAHGAGRRMSRTKAKATFTWDTAQRFLRERGVTLLSAGLDEVPMAYKDIDEVMAAQSDLVEPLARFEPRLVKMAPSGEPPED